MEQGYPTREQAEAMVQNRCPTMICANCKVNRWCDVDGVKVSKSAGEAFLAMHDDLDALRVGLKVADINLRNAHDMVRRLADELGSARTGYCSPGIDDLLDDAEAMTKEDKP